MTKDEIIEQYCDLTQKLASLYVNVYDYLDEEHEKQENSEEYDEKAIEEEFEILTGLRNSMGELVLSKVALTDNLTEADLLCKMNYEKSIDEAFTEWQKYQEFEDILNDKDDEK